SKWQKSDWFRDRKIQDRDFLQDISLPDCVPDGPKCPGPFPFQRLIDRWRVTVEQSRQAPSPGNQAPQSIPLTYVTFFRDIANGLLRGAGNTKESVESWFRDRGLAEVAINRAFYVNESCPALYQEWLPHMFGRHFLIGWGVQHPVEVCEL